MEAELLPNDHILYTVNPTGVFEIDRDGKVVWQYLTSKIDHDADRLPNGNTLITGTTAIVEVTPQSEIVWQLRMQGVTPEQISTGTAFYKAERIGAQQEE
jgi:predicted Rdx family selenoprotein